MATIEYFLSKVEILDNGCWKWLGSFTAAGYGQVWHEGRNWRAHKFSYCFLKEWIPKGSDIYLCHMCNNKWCVNPYHMLKGDAEINHQHSLASGEGPKDQRYGRKNIKGKSLPKGIYYDTNRTNFRVSIRVGNKRYQARKKTLEEAIQWRQEMEEKYWV